MHSGLIVHVKTNASLFCLTDVNKTPSRFANGSREGTFTQKGILSVNVGQAFSLTKMHSRGRLDFKSEETNVIKIIKV